MITLTISMKVPFSLTTNSLTQNCRMVPHHLHILNQIRKKSFLFCFLLTHFWHTSSKVGDNPLYYLNGDNIQIKYKGPIQLLKITSQLSLCRNIKAGICRCQKSDGRSLTLNVNLVSLFTYAVLFPEYFWHALFL